MAHPLRGLKPAVALLALPLAACAATASQTWRPAGASTTPWTFTGSQKAFGETTILINQEPVLQGKVSVWSGRGEMTGTYQGQAVAASCRKGDGSQVRTQCALTVDGRKATTLYFRIE